MKVKPASRRISARRGDAEARMSFVEDTTREEYYTGLGETPWALVQGQQKHYAGELDVADGNNYGAIFQHGS